ncbi:MAG: hypothetical protein AAGE43_00665 [Pseudomonadota bacterium]
MVRVSFSIGAFHRLAALLLAAALAGCTAMPTLEPATPAPEPQPVAASPEPTEPVTTPVPVFTADGPPVVIVLNDSRNAQLEMLRVFSARLGRPYQILNIAHRGPEAVQARLEKLAPIETIALGPAAYSLAAKIPGLDVFYAGVLDPASTNQGVDALPPFDVQLDYWQHLSPDLKRIGVIGGPGMAGRMAALALRCAERGLTLDLRQVSSDKETLFAFRAMVPHIDGFVFLPDEEVLSPRVILQVMSHGQRNDVEILVYSPVMYKLGGSLFLQPDPVHVAEALIELLDDPKQRPQVHGMRSRTRLERSTGDRVAMLTADPSPAGY